MFPRRLGTKQAQRTRNAYGGNVSAFPPAAVNGHRDHEALSLRSLRQLERATATTGAPDALSRQGRSARDRGRGRGLRGLELELDAVDLEGRPCSRGCGGEARSDRLDVRRAQRIRKQRARRCDVELAARALLHPRHRVERERARVPELRPVDARDVAVGPGDPDRRPGRRLEAAPVPPLEVAARRVDAEPVVDPAAVIGRARRGASVAVDEDEHLVVSRRSRFGSRPPPRRGSSRRGRWQPSRR